MDEVGDVGEFDRVAREIVCHAGTVATDGHVRVGLGRVKEVGGAVVLMLMVKLLDDGGPIVVVIAGLLELAR